MIRTLLKALALATPLALLTAASAGAHGGHGFGGNGTSGMLDSLDIGGPSWSGPYGYTYAPPSLAVPSDNALSSASPPGTITPAAPPVQCRDYHGDATMQASGAPFIGRACLEADGQWHSVQ